MKIRRAPDRRQPPSTAIDGLLACLEEVRRSGEGWTARCPAHDDREPSLSVALGADGRILVNCHAGCRTEHICAALGIAVSDLFADTKSPAREPIATYDYMDQDGTLLYQVVRFPPKDFRQRRPDGAGGWTWNLDGVRRVLYRLPQLRAAVAARKRIFVCEGEKDVAAVEAHGFAATTNPGGAGKWRAEYNTMLQGADVVIVADRDAPGRAHAQAVATALRGVAVKVVVVEPAEGKDVSDHLAAGKRLVELVPIKTPDPSTMTTRLTPWEYAEPAPDFIATVEASVDFLHDRLLVRGAVTEMFSPRGLGKTHIGHAVAVKLAQTGLRVLLLDRDNPPREIRRRLKGWAAATAPTLHVLTRDKAPRLTDRAWESFPVDAYDVVVVDSLDATTEGVGEQDSSKPSRALAPILDIAHRANGPAVLVLGNTVKSAAHSRGSGVVEDRADIVYEVRDATNLTPTGSKPWWQELPPAGAEAWAERANRRRRRTVYRLALVPSKFRLGEEPEPFILEVDLGGEPWTLREVTGDVVRAGAEAKAETARELQARRDTARDALVQEIADTTDGERLTVREAIAFLRERHLTRDGARALVEAENGRSWRLEQRPNLRGRPLVLVPLGEVVIVAGEISRLDNSGGTGTSDGHFPGPRQDKAPEEWPEIALVGQGFPTRAISPAAAMTPGRACSKCTTAMRHYGTTPDAGWVCPACHPAADRAMQGTGA